MSELVKCNSGSRADCYAVLGRHMSVWRRGLVAIVVTVSAAAFTDAQPIACDIAKVIGSHGNFAGQFGWSIDVEADVMAIGAPFVDEIANQSGASFIFGRSSGVWREETVLAPSSLGVGDLFGFAVDLDAAGGGLRIAVGAPSWDCSVGPINCGAAFIFELNSGVWTSIGELFPDSSDEEQFFGGAVSIEGDRVVVGAPRSNSSRGCAYVFEFDGTTWNKTSKLQPQLPTEWFGASVSLDGVRLAIGAQRDSDQSSAAGAVLIFELDESGVWQERQKLTASDGGVTTSLGYSLDLQGNMILAGAPGGTGPNAGAYVFERVDMLGSWIETHKLVPSDPSMSDNFGLSVSLRGSLAAVGQHGSSVLRIGGAYLFETETWTQIDQVFPRTPNSEDGYGAPVIVTSDSIIVGAFGDTNPNAQYAGAAHVFLRRDVLSGNVDTGDGSAPSDVIFVNARSGNDCNVITLDSGVPCTISIARAPQGSGAYAFWLYDFRKYAGAPIQYRKNGTTYDLGPGVKALPINNSVTPGSVPCPLTFPTGWTSQSLGSGAAGTFCLNSQPGFPRAPTSFNVIFPPGNFILGGLVTDQNSINSPALNVSIANWIFVRSR